MMHLILMQFFSECLRESKSRGLGSNDFDTVPSLPGSSPALYYLQASGLHVSTFRTLLAAFLASLQPIQPLRKARGSMLSDHSFLLEMSGPQDIFRASFCFSLCLTAHYSRNIGNTDTEVIYRLARLRTIIARQTLILSFRKFFILKRAITSRITTFYIPNMPLRSPIISCIGPLHAFPWYYKIPVQPTLR